MSIALNGIWIIASGWFLLVALDCWILTSVNQFNSSLEHLSEPEQGTIMPKENSIEHKI
jgi:hypothetical protein